MRIFAILLIVTGVLMFIFNGREYQRESTVLNAGTFEIKKKHTDYVVWPSMAGTVSLIAGIVLLVRSKKKSVS